MLTRRRFRALAESYGANLQRWPEHVRADAQALLERSREARECLADARKLDAAIDAVGAQHPRPDAALERLRAGVAARIVSIEPSTDRRWRWLATAIARAFAPDPSWLAIAGGGGIAVIAGLLIGGMYMSAPPSEALLPMLEPAPIHFLAE